MVKARKASCAIPPIIPRRPLTTPVKRVRWNGTQGFVAKEACAQVCEATVRLKRVLTMQVSCSVDQSTVAGMIKLVTEALRMKAPSDRFSHWFKRRYRVAFLAASVLAYGVMLWEGFAHQQALYKAATLLVMASPYAVVISVPAAILSALSAAARGGVLCCSRFAPRLSGWRQ